MNLISPIGVGMVTASSWFGLAAAGLCQRGNRVVIAISWVAGWRLWAKSGGMLHARKPTGPFAPPPNDRKGVLSWFEVTAG